VFYRVVTTVLQRNPTGDPIAVFREPILLRDERRGRGSGRGKEGKRRKREKGRLLR